MKTFSEFRTNVYHDDPDEIGIIVMWESGRKNATKKALDEWDEFIGTEFPTHLLEGYDDWLELKRRKVSRIINECKSRGIEVLTVLKNPEMYLDKMAARDLELHGWDLYVESINNKQQ